MVWPFKKKEPLHPLADRFRVLTEDKRVLEWFGKITHGYPPHLPADIGTKIKEAMDLSYTITSMIGGSTTALLEAAKLNNFSAISEALLETDRHLGRRAQEQLSEMQQIIKWAEKYDLPELRPVNTMAAKESGVPRDAKKLQGLRYLFLEPGLGIEEIPEEIANLPLLQVIAIPGNKIKNIPIAIYKCTSLQRLDLYDNEIERIENGIHYLENVHTVDLSGNCLSYVTPDIARMPSLRKLDVSEQRVDFGAISQPSLSVLNSLSHKIDVTY